MNASEDNIHFTGQAGEWIHLLQPGPMGVIYQHAQSTYPRECCGMVLASGAVRRCDNAQDKLHLLDPVVYPQTSAHAYCFDADDQLFLAQSFEGGDRVRIVYHSHPDAPPELSETDRRGARFNSTEIYPGLAFLVVRSSAKGVGPAKLFTYSNDDYVEIAAWRSLEKM